MSAQTVHSAESLSRVVGEIRAALKEHRWLKVSWSQHKDRSGQQNALSHVWYEQIAHELREDTALGVKAECKLHYGVPILRAEDDDFRAAYDAAIKPLTYEQKLAAMRYWPVTSLMSTAQLSEYLQAMQDAYRGRVTLEFPDEWRWAA